MYKKFTTSAGLRVILAPRQDTESITIALFCGAGSVDEDKNNNGISHFIEHMMFRGTIKRPVSLDISKEIDGVGAIFNAYTSKNHTNYYIKIASEQKEKAFDILSDMIKNSKFDPSDIEKELGVIFEEMKMYEDNPLYYIEDLFESLVFNKHELGRMIIGTRSSLPQIKRKNIQQYLNKFYQPKNFVLSIAGKFKDDEIKKLIKKYFNFSTGTVRPKIKPYKQTQSQPRTAVLYKETEQVNLALGFPAYDYHHKNFPALSVFSTILGGNMSSRLFVKVREQASLCYFIKTSVNSYQNTGNLMIQSGLDKSRLTEAVKLIIQELENIRDNDVLAEELQRAKDFLAGQLIIQLEDSENVANYYGRQEILLNKITDIKEKIEKIKKVTIKEVAQAAKDIINKKKINLAIIGPVKNIEGLKKLLK